MLRHLDLRLLAMALCALLALPVLAIGLAWLSPQASSWELLQHLVSTVLPGYALNSMLLVLGVALGVALLGGATAAAVALFEFPGRRHFEWALLLPLAMPAYVLAYAMTDFLQYSGPLQGGLRAAFGFKGPLWPDVRSLPGAVLLFTLALYPYVYLLTRAALAERGVHLMEAARMLGAPLARRIREVALPLARPAIAAGVALAMMETLADYGVGSFFGLSTFTTGIYKAWLVADDRIAAAQLATVLLLVVGVLLAAERRAQTRLRFSGTRGGGRVAPTEAGRGGQVAPSREGSLVPLHGAAAAGALALCALPVLLGFVLPVGILLRAVLIEAAHGGPEGLGGLPWDRFIGWAWTSLRLATIAAVLAVALALLLGSVLRQPRHDRRAAAAGWLARVVSLGYAVPGAVIAVGLLLPVGWFQQAGAPGAALLTALFTGTAFGLVYAYLVRFSAVALQSVEAGYTRIPASFDDSARLLGAGPGRLFAGVHLPLLRRSALAAGLLVFVDVMKELPATLMLRPFNSDTLAVVAYNLARDERLAEAALPSIAIVVVGLAPVLLLSRAMRSR
ncbi:ABC transporter permease [Rivibacter subsaxonicus]|uniref:Iron(III) transport system permease protein n=1 Tax=Rivibacter subsaxonicus TaxID=457575 RepID=A0A4Q7VGW0_9BURK|nr:iron ABC transporter permease [Rivibacter subsaxonicus]RZT95292.1 iron(III) transport system permease protein [Rivibacter subsaxonicus]